jgi:hypothetical protein
MKKFLCLLLPLVLFAGNGAANFRVKNSPLLEVKGGYFIFATDKMRDIYNWGGGSLQLATSIPVWKWLSIYAAGGFQESFGRTHPFHQFARLRQIPGDLGIKTIFSAQDRIQFYLTIGPRYFYMQQKSRISDLYRTVSRNGVGCFANSGFNFYPWKRVFIDLFAEYSYEPISSHVAHDFGLSPQVGGFLFGGGIGYRF